MTTRIPSTMLGLVEPGSSTAALQAALNDCATRGVPFIGTPGTWTLTATLTINCPGDLSMMTLNVASASVTPAIRVGTTTGDPTRLRGRLQLPKLVNSTKPGTGWASQGIGVELANLYESEVYLPYVTGFAVGLDCGGYTSGFAYNTVSLGAFIDNQVSVRLQGKNATGGWANQNTFIGGRLSISTGEGSAISGARYIQAIPLDTVTANATSWPNGNTFVGVSVEGNGPEYHAEIAGHHNTLVNCRFEATTPAILFTGHASNTYTYENLLVGGFKSSQATITKSGKAVYNGIMTPRTTSLESSGVTMNLRNDSASSSPLIQGFEATVEALNKTSADTDWSYRVSSQQLQGKRSTDTDPRVILDFVNGRASLTGLQNFASDGAAATGGVAVGGLYRNGSAVQVRVT